MECFRPLSLVMGLEEALGWFERVGNGACGQVVRSAIDAGLATTHYARVSEGELIIEPYPVEDS